MKKFCEDEGYDYWKFCKLAREGQMEIWSKTGTDKRSGFIEVNPDGLCGIISEELGHNPRKPKSVYVFSGRNPRVKKVLIREYNRYGFRTSAVRTLWNRCDTTYNTRCSATW